jgi:hypothetical protein
MDLDLDRLSLRLTGLSATDGRRLARLVAEYLAAADPPGAPVAADRLRVSVAAHAGESLDALAQRIATETLYALARSS